MTGLTMLVLASVAFVGTHFLMSHPLRSGMVAALGEKGFAGSAGSSVAGNPSSRTPKLKREESQELCPS